MRYYHAHAIIATAINIIGGMILGAWWLGGAFYAARELVQWRGRGRFDWQGFCWPVAATIPLWVLSLVA
ncbi:MAG: hypothetical protein ACE5FM_08370 [Methyloligellaceae bacterium]